MAQEQISLIFILTALSLLPIFFIMTTSFIKIAMVCIIARESLGVQQVPPNIILYGLSLVLSFYIMGPVYNKTYTNLSSSVLTNKNITVPLLINSVQLSATPVKNFLIKHSEPSKREYFYSTLKKYWTPEMMADVSKDDYVIVVPAFVISELTQGFKIAFLIYLPAMIIDIIVSNILMAMGMMMMSPTTISLPIKLLLFISIDGWERLIKVLMSTY